MKSGKNEVKPISSLTRKGEVNSETVTLIASSVFVKYFKRLKIFLEFS